MSSIDGNSIHCVQRLSRANFADVEKLHTAVYGKAPVPGFFERKYNTTYTGVEHAGYIAYNKQMMSIAFYGVLPCFLLVDGNQVLAAQSADTMTHPDYRNKGLFAELANLTFTLCKELGIKLIFGFPNQNSLPGFTNKLGWRQAERMTCFVIPLKTLPLKKIATKFPGLQNAYSRHTEKILKKNRSSSLGINSSAIAEGFDGVLHNEGYLQNKTYTSTQVIKIKGADVWIKLTDNLLIGDIDISSATFKPVMNGLIGVARKLGINQLQFHISPGTQLYRLFKDQYRSIDSFPVIFKDLGAGISTEKIKFTFADIDIF